MTAVLDTVALALVLIGALLCLTAAIGLLRFRDVPSRLHAATKPQVLGLLLIVIAIALALRDAAAIAFLIPIVLIQLATAPLSAHMVGRQAYRNGTVAEDSLVTDELAQARAAAREGPDEDTDLGGEARRAAPPTTRTPTGSDPGGSSWS